MAEIWQTVIAAIIIIIVILTMGIIFNEQSSEIFGIIIDSFDKVFVVDEEADAQTKTVASFEKLFSNVDDYCYGGFNTIGGTECLCYSQTLGSVSESSSYLIQNIYSQSASSVSVLNIADGTYEARETKPYTLGVMVVNGKYGVWTGVTGELGCVFPDSYYIVGKDVKQGPFGLIGAKINNLYLYWEDDRTDKWPHENGPDYTFQFYEDKDVEQNACLGIPPVCDDTTSYSYLLKAAPIFYKVDETRLCILTDLIERPIEVYNEDNYYGFGIDASDKTQV
ncbi:MAG: hypothetical protein ISS01_02475, partial [Nanoarchaeota archaeon]|nr:hypothetical protein [Nanoarchaeota archaeon]